MRPREIESRPGHVTPPHSRYQFSNLAPLGRTEKRGLNPKLCVGLATHFSKTALDLADGRSCLVVQPARYDGFGCVIQFERKLVDTDALPT